MDIRDLLLRVRLAKVPTLNVPVEDALFLVVDAVKHGCVSGEDVQSYFALSERAFIGATGIIEWDHSRDVISKKYETYIVVGENYEKNK